MRSLWATWTGRGLSTGSFAGKVVATLIGVAYFLYGAWQNLRITLVPMRYDGDHAQAVAHYWRYAVDGAMPPGDLLTDYAFLMHAPVGWWLPMAGLSMVVSPLVAAKLLSVVAYAATGSLAWLIVQRKGNAYLAAAALILVARCSASHFFLAGGYARSFGPALVLLFLAAWLLWGHRVVLVVLVVQAALYPSVVIPCGLTYGAYCVLAGPMRDRLRRCASLTVAGVLIIGLGLMQDLRAPKEWGSVVWLEEALEMPAWGRGGRITEAPLKPISAEVEKNFIRAYTTHGKVPLKVKVSPRTMARWFAMGWGVALLLVVLRKLWRGPEDEPFALPWQLPALYVGAFAGYMLARLLAFKLYLPYRALAHTWVWIVLLAMPLVAYELGMWLFERHKARATAFAVVLSVVPTIALLGGGLA